MFNMPLFDLISGIDITIDNICSLRQPTLNDIRSLGYNQYLAYTNLFLLDEIKFMEIWKVKVKPELENSQQTIFSLLISENNTRQAFLEALAFFIVEDIEFDPNKKLIRVLHEESGSYTQINEDNYGILQDIVSQMNFVGNKELPPKKFRNSKAREIYELIFKGKAEVTTKVTADQGLNIPNIISAIVANHGAYTYDNIWSLTIYQLYDLFFRLNIKIQLGIIGMKWAAWGKDKFDFSEWYKNPNIKNKGDKQQ